MIRKKRTVLQPSKREELCENFCKELLRGKSPREAANSIGRSVRTVSHWLSEDWFETVFKRVRNTFVQEVTNFKDLLPMFPTVCQAILTDPTIAAKDKLRAEEVVIKILDWQKEQEGEKKDVDSAQEEQQRIQEKEDNKKREIETARMFDLEDNYYLKKCLKAIGCSREDWKMVSSLCEYLDGEHNEDVHCKEMPEPNVEVLNEYFEVWFDLFRLSTVYSLPEQLKDYEGRLYNHVEMILKFREWITKGRDKRKAWRIAFSENIKRATNMGLDDPPVKTETQREEDENEGLTISTMSESLRESRKLL